MEENQTRKLIHFRLAADIWHCWYIVEPLAERGYVLWQKIYGTDMPCTCPNPEQVYEDSVKERSLVQS